MGLKIVMSKMITLLIVMVTGSYNQGGYREGGELEERKNS